MKEGWAEGMKGRTEGRIEGEMDRRKEGRIEGEMDGRKD